MKVHLFFNPAAAAGRAAMRLGVALAHFRTLGVPLELYRPSSAADARAKMAALAGTEDRVVVVGGDGMVHQAANALRSSGTVLGVIPAGTGNDTAVSLGLPNEVEEACSAAVRDPLEIDLIVTEAGVAVTVATAGFSVAVNERADAMRRLQGASKYTISSLIELRRMTSHQMTMTLDGVEHEIEANLIAIANTAYFGGGMKIAPAADPTDGELDVVVVGPASKAAFAAILPTVFSGRHTKSRYVRTHRAKTVELAGAALNLRADGEPLGALPSTLTVERKVLLVAGASA